MATELHNQNLNELILQRPNSQRIFRLLREMQHSVAEDVGGDLRQLNGVANVAATMLTQVHGINPQTKSTLTGAATPNTFQ